MASTKISDMTTATTHVGADLAGVQSGANKKLPMSLIKDYKCYVALLSQSGTDAPVATILENSLGGTPTPGYSDVGTYSFTLNGAFTVNKTWVSITQGYGAGYTFLFYRTDANVVSLDSLDATNTVFNTWDYVCIEIRVYN